MMAQTNKKNCFFALEQINYFYLQFIDFKNIFNMRVVNIQNLHRSMNSIYSCSYANNNTREGDSRQ